MLRPAECITNCRALIRTGSSDERVRNFVEKCGGNAADFLDHFGRVASKMAAQGLENGARMLQGRIALRKAEAGLAFVEPALLVVGALLLVPAGEKAGLSFFGVAKIFAQNAGRVGEVHDVIAEKKIVLDNVPDEPAEKRDVAAGADRHPDIGQRARARKSWIDMHDGRAPLLCFYDPAEADRVSFGHGRAFD